MSMDRDVCATCGYAILPGEGCACPDPRDATIAQLNQECEGWAALCKDKDATIAQLRREVEEYREAMRDRSLVLCETHGIGYSAKEGCAWCQRDRYAEALRDIAEYVVRGEDVREFARAALGEKAP